MQSASSWEIPIRDHSGAIDRAEVARALRLFMEPGKRHAIQALRSGRWEIATLDSLESALEVVERFSDEDGIYVGMNPLRDEFQKPAKGGWNNPDVAHRRWFLIDADAERPAGTNATDAEKKASKNAVDSVIADLGERGWPAPIIADSGNGFHAYYRIDLPNDKPSQKLLSAALKALGEKHNTPGATIDRAVHDAKRITKLFGTWARKARHSTDRPHRMARLVSVPDSIEVVAPELIEAISGHPTAAPPAANGHAPTNGNGNGNGNGWAAPVVDPGNGSAYARAALEAEAAKVASATSGRNAQLYEAALKVGGYVASGLIDESEVRAQLLAAAAVAGLGQDGDPLESERAIDNGLAVGKQAAKTPPPKPEGETKKKRPAKPLIADPITGLKEPIDDERRLARVYLKTRRKHQDRPLLVDWNGGWNGWRDSAWHPITDRDLDAELTDSIKAEFERLAIAAGTEVLPVSTALLGNVRNSLRALVNLPAHRAPHQPTWIDTIGPSPAECVNCRNGILHLPTLFEKGPEMALTPPTPFYFAANTLGFDFDPNPPAPEAWLAFLDSIWPNDPESIAALQQWFGYLLTPDTRQQKLLLLLGPKRCGKGTIIRTLTSLVGKDNVVSPKLASLGSPFGPQCLIGKMIAFCADARISGRADTQAIIEVLLSVSGEDPQTIERKHKEAWSGRLPTRFVLAANELPRLGDYSEALLSRLIILRFHESFEGREDRGLEKKIAAELPGILAWAFAGWESLHAAGRFTQPATGQDEIKEFKELNNPIGAFLAECCEIGPEYEVIKRRLYEAWAQWCKDHGKDRPGDVQGLCRNVKTSLAALSVKLQDTQPRDPQTGRQVRAFKGLRLIDDRPF